MKREVTKAFEWTMKTLFVCRKNNNAAIECTVREIMSYRNSSGQKNPVDKDYHKLRKSLCDLREKQEKISKLIAKINQCKNEANQI